MNVYKEQVEALQNLMVSRATGDDECDADYVRLRQVVLSERRFDSLVPSFVRTCRSLPQFWQFIKGKHAKYAERREFIWGEFRPLLDRIESDQDSPADSLVTGAVERMNSAYAQAIWSKALDRRTADPEGAITVARTLLESVCKQILDECGVAHDDNPDMNRLYRLTAEELRIAPSQHTEQVFKQILGGCTAVVEGLAALRNRLGDAHGKGKVGIRPAPRHAELAVNLSGALAVYLLATHEARKDVPT
jgi:hypothetical protein